MKRLASPGLISLVLVALTSCAISTDPSLGFVLRDRLRQLPGLAWLKPIVPLAEVGQHRQSIALLQGQVDQHLPLVGQTLYQLTDNSGRLWVITTEPPPPLGAQVTLRATIHYKSILMRGQDIGEYYAEELERTLEE
jgi:hypothetical protein